MSPLRKTLNKGVQCPLAYILRWAHGTLSSSNRRKCCKDRKNKNKTKKPQNWLLEEVALYFLWNLGATLSLVLFRAYCPTV